MLSATSTQQTVSYTKQKISIPTEFETKGKCDNCGKLDKKELVMLHNLSSEKKKKE